MAVVCVPAAQSGEDKNIKIDARDSTAEWAMLYDRGVETGKRLNSFCEGTDYVKAEVLGEKFTVCRKYKMFLSSKQFSGSPQAFQLGFLSTLN